MPKSDRTVSRRGLILIALAILAVLALVDLLGDDSLLRTLFSEDGRFDPWGTVRDILDRRRPRRP